MVTQAAEALISSKEILARTGISRATLNNYISLNLIPPPRVRRPATPGGPTKMGYFPAWTVERIEEIRELKAAGMRMAEIAAHFREKAEEAAARLPEAFPDLGYNSIEQVVFPAILVNPGWEIIWINQKAEQIFFKERVHEIASAAKRNILRLFLASALPHRFSNWKEILLAHFRLAKRDLAEEVIEQICLQLPAGCQLEQLRQLWQQAEPLQERPISQQSLVLKPHDGRSMRYTLFSSEFREGTLLFYTPARMQLDHILNLLMGRERLIKAVLSQRIPSLTPLCILAGRLESRLHLRTALPPHEYFDLVNQVTLMAHHCFKQYRGTPGRSFHEGVVGFFLSAPDAPRNYLQQALQCAHVLQKMVSVLDRRWKYRKRWKNSLRLNIGLHCGHEWLGTIPSSLAFEFTVMGETLEETIKLSKFAEGGTTWASKKVIETLLPRHRQRVEFGIRHGFPPERFLSPGIYSQVRELLSFEEIERRGLREIANLAVTEIVHVEAARVAAG